MDVMARRQALLNMTGSLPPMYRRCDYLQTNGTYAKIDTGVAGNDETLEFDLDYATIVRQAYAAAFGNYVNENTRCWRLINNGGTGDTPYYLLTAYNRRAGASTGMQAVPTTSDTIVGKRINFHISNGYVETHCDDYTYQLSINADTTTDISTRNIAIGAAWPEQTGGGTLVGRFWHFKIWSHGVLIRNYIPCIRCRDNKAGFYDLINHTFNPSIGSADFIAGYDE